MSKIVREKTNNKPLNDCSICSESVVVTEIVIAIIIVLMTATI